MSKGKKVAKQQQRAAARVRAQRELTAEYSKRNNIAATTAREHGISPTQAAKLIAKGALEPVRW